MRRSFSDDAGRASPARASSQERAFTDSDLAVTPTMQAEALRTFETERVQIRPSRPVEVVTHRLDPLAHIVDAQVAGFNDLVGTFGVPALGGG